MAEDGGGTGRWIAITLIFVIGLLTLCCTGVWFFTDGGLLRYLEEDALRVSGNGVRAEETRDATGFTGVVVRGWADVDVLVGPEFAVIVEADENLLPLITTDVDDGALVIASTTSFDAAAAPIVSITLPAIERFELLGAGDATIAGAVGKRLAIRVAGAGDVMATGNVADVELTVTGAGDIDAFGLRAERAVVEIGGAGNVEVFAAEKLTATVSGSGVVLYDGDPASTAIDVTGSGEVTRR